MNGLETANLLLRMNDCAGDSPHGSHELFGPICSYPVTHAFAMGSVQLGDRLRVPKGSCLLPDNLSDGISRFSATLHKVDW